MNEHCLTCSSRQETLAGAATTQTWADGSTSRIRKPLSWLVTVVITHLDHWITHFFGTYIYIPAASKGQKQLYYLNFDLVFLETGQFSSKPFKLDKSAKSSILGLMNPNFGLNAWASFSSRQYQHDPVKSYNYQPMYIYAEKHDCHWQGTPILMVDHHFNLIRVHHAVLLTCIRARAGDSFHMGGCVGSLRPSTCWSLSTLKPLGRNMDD